MSESVDYKFSDLRPGDMLVLKASSTENWHVANRTKGLLVISCVNDRTWIQITFLTLWSAKGFFYERFEKWTVEPSGNSKWWMLLTP